MAAKMLFAGAMSLLIAASLAQPAAASPRKVAASATRPSHAERDRENDARLLQSLLDRRLAVASTPLPQPPDSRARQAAEARRDALAFVDRQIEILRGKRPN